MPPVRTDSPSVCSETVFVNVGTPLPFRSGRHLRGKVWMLTGLLVAAGLAIQKSQTWGSLALKPSQEPEVVMTSTERYAPLPTVFEMVPTDLESKLLARTNSRNLVELDLDSGSSSAYRQPEEVREAQFLARTATSPLLVSANQSDQFSLHTTSDLTVLQVPRSMEVYAAQVLEMENLIVTASCEYRETSNGPEERYRLDLVDLVSGGHLKTVELPSLVFDMAYDAATRKIFVASGLGIDSYSLHRGSWRHLHDQPSRSLEISNADRVLITGGFRGTLVAFGLDSLEELWQQETGLTTAIKAMKVSEEKSLVAVGGERTDVLLLDVVTGVPQANFSQGSRLVNDLVFLSHGDRLLVMQADATVTIWDVEYGTPVKFFQLANQQDGK